MRVAIDGQWLENLEPTYENIVATTALLHYNRGGVRLRRAMASIRIGIRRAHGEAGAAIYQGSDFVGYIRCGSRAAFRQLTSSIQDAGLVWNGEEYRRTVVHAWYHLQLSKTKHRARQRHGN